MCEPLAALTAASESSSSIVLLIAGFILITVLIESK